MAAPSGGERERVLGGVANGLYVPFRLIYQHCQMLSSTFYHQARKCRPGSDALEPGHAAAAASVGFMAHYALQALQNIEQCVPEVLEFVRPELSTSLLSEKAIGPELMALIGQRYFYVDADGYGEVPQFADMCCCSVCGLSVSAETHKKYCPRRGAPFVNWPRGGLEVPTFSQKWNPVSVSVAEAAAAEARARAASKPADMLSFNWGVCPDIGGKEGVNQPIGIRRWISPSCSSSASSSSSQALTVSTVGSSIQGHSSSCSPNLTNYSQWSPELVQTFEQVNKSLWQPEQLQPNPAVPQSPQPQLQSQQQSAPLTPHQPSVNSQCFRGPVVQTQQQQQQQHTPCSPQQQSFRGSGGQQHQPILQPAHLGAAIQQELGPMDFSQMAQFAALVHDRSMFHFQQLLGHEHAFGQCWQAVNHGRQCMELAQQYIQQHAAPIAAAQPDPSAASLPHVTHAPHRSFPHC